MNKSLINIGKVIIFIFLLISTYGVLSYFALIIKRLDWRGITFYGILTIIILFRLGEIIIDILNSFKLKEKKE